MGLEMSADVIVHMKEIFSSSENLFSPQGGITSAAASPRLKHDQVRI